jgi:membrane-bound ClpP family serine protease
MGIGTGIFLIVVGAILSFAVQDMISGVDLTMIGYICMVAGVLALIISLVINQQRANTTHTERIERREDRHIHDDGAV